MLALSEVLPQVTAHMRRVAEPAEAPQAARKDQKKPQGPARPTRAQEATEKRIQAVMPAGAEMAWDYWLAAVTHEVKATRLKADYRARILDVARIVHRDRDTTGTARPGVSRVAQLLRLGLRTVQRVIRWLKERRLLVTTARGRTAEWNAYRENDREVFALIRPRLAKTGTPSVKKLSYTELMRSALGPGYRRLSRYDMDMSVWHPFRTPKSPQELERAAEEFMRRQRPHTFKDVTAKQMAKILRPYFKRGATIPGLMHMLNRRPNGMRWPHDGAKGVRKQVPWARARLRHWDGVKELPRLWAG